MTETTDPLAPKPVPATGRGLKVAFALSLAFNLLIVGLVAGAWLREGGPGGGLPRDLSFGPFSEALSPDDRRAIRKALGAERDSFMAGREAAKAEFDRLLDALRADPFDPAAVDAALAAVVARSAGRLKMGQDLLADRIGSMTATDRLAFADRLEGALRHRHHD